MTVTATGAATVNFTCDHHHHRSHDDHSKLTWHFGDTGAVLTGGVLYRCQEVSWMDTHIVWSDPQRPAGGLVDAPLQSPGSAKKRYRHHSQLQTTSCQWNLPMLLWSGESVMSQAVCSSSASHCISASEAKAGPLQPSESLQSMFQHSFQTT